MNTSTKSSGGEDSSGELDRYNEFYQEILHPYSATGILIFAFVRSKLYQYNLRFQHDEASILSEVYIRTIDHIAKGGNVTNASAWTKAVAYNVIREIARRKPKNQQIDDSFLENLLHHSPLETEGDCTILTAKILKMREAFKLLDPKEQLLIYRKIILNESWATIQKAYGDHSLAALRKQKERAIAKLRKIYTSLSEA